MTELIDDAPKPPEKRYSQKYPGLVQLTWEESEKLVRDAEQTRNSARAVFMTGPRDKIIALWERAGLSVQASAGDPAEVSALQRRSGAVGIYRRPRKSGWIHTIPPHKPRHGADWGIVLALSVALGFALLVLIVLANV